MACNSSHIGDIVTNAHLNFGDIVTNLLLNFGDTVTFNIDTLEIICDNTRELTMKGQL